MRRTKVQSPAFSHGKGGATIKRPAQGQQRMLLDVGCGPATLRSLLEPNIQYYGRDIAIHDPAPNLIESNFPEEPVRFN